MTKPATPYALPVEQEDLDAAKRLRDEITRQLGPRRGLDKVEHHDFDVQLLAGHRLAARRRPADGRSPSVARNLVILTILSAVSWWQGSVTGARTASDQAFTRSWTL